MYVLLALAFATLMSVAFWIDNAISHPLLRFWWVALVVAWLLCCLDLSLRQLRYRDRMLVAGLSGIASVAVIFPFGDLLTTYLITAIIFCAAFTAWYLDRSGSKATTRVFFATCAFLVVAMVALPLAINRVELRLPNLSGGTYLTVEASGDKRPPISAGFFNRSDDHSELTTFHGTTMYAGNAVAPALRIEVLRSKIVIRLLSIRYQSHIGYLDMTLSEISGNDLSQLIALNQDSTSTLSMDGERLLITGLEVDRPIRINLPPPDLGELSVSRWGLAVVIRIILLGLLGYLLWALMPARRAGHPGEVA